MDYSKFTVTMEEFKLFHSIDRKLFLILVQVLCRNPIECLQIMGLWLWLERGGFSNVIYRILSLPPFLIDEFADEAVACLRCINGQVPVPQEASEIPLTQCLVKKDISLQLFYDNRFTAFYEVQNLVRVTCFPAFSDLLKDASQGGVLKSQGKKPVHAASSSSANYSNNSSFFSGVFPGESSSANYSNNSSFFSGVFPGESSAANYSNNSPFFSGAFPGESSSANYSNNSSFFSSDSLMESFSSLGIKQDVPPPQDMLPSSEASRCERTMFVTFSKGYPVSEMEVRDFFTQLFGNCIDSIFMQESKNGEQSLYAKIVFLRPAFINVILHGLDKAKFTINGKHVWMRKYVPKHGRPIPSGFTSMATSPWAF